MEEFRQDRVRVAQSELRTTDPTMASLLSMQQLIAKIAKGHKTAKDLTWEEAKQAMRLIIEGAATPAQIGAFLVAMRFKAESVTELAAFTATARQYVPPIPIPSGLSVVDVPTYAGKQETFHVIIPAAIVAASAGAVILMHGSEGPPDRRGTSPILQGLGVPIDLLSRPRVVSPPGEPVSGDAPGVGGEEPFSSGGADPQSGTCGITSHRTVASALF
jgi:glycosyl transferase family protein with helical bundle domain